MNSVHALKVAVRMLEEQRRREMQRFERGLGVRAQANVLQRVADIDEVTTTLVALRQHIADQEARNEAR